MKFLKAAGLQLAIAGAYVGAGKLGLLVPAGHHIITLVWAPSGIALSALLLFGYRVLPALVAGALAVNLTAGAPPLVACAIAVGNPLEALAGAAMLRQARFRIEMDRVRDVLALALLAAGVGTAVSATIGVGALWAASQVPSALVLRNGRDWWLGDAMGVLVVAPLVLTWAATIRESREGLRARSPLEEFALATLKFGASAIIFLRPAQQEVAFLAFPLLIACALRLGPRGAATASFVCIGVALAGTLLGRGPFGGGVSGTAIAHLHLFMGTAAVTSLLLAASISEREAAQEALRRREEETRNERKMQSLGHLAGGIANDFNNLLTVVQGHASILETTIPLDDSRRGSVDEIARAARRGAEATKRILSFGRRDEGTPALVNPAAAVRGLVPLVRPLLGTSIALRVDVEERMPCVKIDPAQLEQALLNLVLNARDAMPSGGVLTLRAASDGNGTDSGRAVRLSVLDTGVGMDEAARQRMFEPYFTTKPRGRGAGLGLAVVHGIVTRAGGSADARSEPGRGTEVTLRLPAILSGATPPPSKGLSGPARGGNETILVVEADEMVWAVVREVLTAHGYEVLVASTGARALQQLRLHPGNVSLLLTDIDLPDSSGAELASLAMTESPGLRTLFMSGHPESVLEQAGLGNARILHKPFSPDALARAVRREMDAARPARSFAV